MVRSIGTARNTARQPREVYHLAAAGGAQPADRKRGAGRHDQCQNSGGDGRRSGHGAGAAPLRAILAKAVQPLTHEEVTSPVHLWHCAYHWHVILGGTVARPNAEPTKLTLLR